MEIRKNWFTYFALTVFSACMGYILFSGILALGSSMKYPFLWYGGSFVIMGTLWLIAHVFSLFVAKFKLTRFFPKQSPYGILLEGLFLLAVLSASAVARVWVINNFPMEPASDYKTYYQIATMLSQGNLLRDGVGLCDYVSYFPHVFGYSYILSLLFKITGASVSAGLYLNMVVSLLCVVFAYLIVRMLCGRAGGMIAAVLVAFWPSQILYSNFLAAEPVFACMMLFSLGLAVYLFKYPIEKGKPSRCLLLNIALGISLALASAVRPMSVILLIAVILCVLPCRIPLTKDKNEVELLRRGMYKGWFRALVIGASYFLCSFIISNGVAAAIDRELPGGTVSFGYNLLVGLNIESKGSWNDPDARLLDEKFSATGSTVEAQKACRDEAIKRLGENPVGIANLAMEKFTFLWRDDDYASHWNLLFMEQQNNLTPDRKNLINAVIPWNNIYYLFCVFFSLTIVPSFWRKEKGSPAQMLVLLFIGTVMVHMVLENQNRYHYNILPVFAILASIGMVEIYHHYARKPDTPVKQELPIPQEPSVVPPAAPAAVVEDKRFDMLSAIENGHVTVTVSEAYRKKEEGAKSSKPEERREEDKNFPRESTEKEPESER